MWVILLSTRKEERPQLQTTSSQMCSKWIHGESPAGSIQDLLGSSSEGWSNPVLQGKKLRNPRGCGVSWAFCYTTRTSWGTARAGLHHLLKTQLPILAAKAFRGDAALPLAPEPPHPLSSWGCFRSNSQS